MTAVNPPLQSMTGFAAADGSLGEATWTWSLKSVNGKSLDIRWRMPSRMDVLEQSLRKALLGEIARGSVSASLQLELPNAKQDVQVNQELYDRLSAFARIMATAWFRPTQRKSCACPACWRPRPPR